MLVVNRNSDLIQLSSLSLFRDAEHMILSANDNHLACDRGRSHYDFSHRITSKQLKRRSSPDNKYLTILADEINFSICGDR